MEKLKNYNSSFFSFCQFYYFSQICIIFAFFTIKSQKIGSKKFNLMEIYHSFLKSQKYINYLPFLRLITKILTWKCYSCFQRTYLGRLTHTKPVCRDCFQMIFFCDFITIFSKTTVSQCRHNIYSFFSIHILLQYMTFAALFDRLIYLMLCTVVLVTDSLDPFYKYCILP